MAAVALLTCPCHLPLWFAVLGGTAVGAAFARHPGLALLALTVLFALSAWSALRLFTQARPAPREGRRAE